MRTILNQALNHSFGLTDNLTNSLNMLESLHKQSNQSQNRLSAELASSWIQKTASYKETPPQALVTPRVNGHEIHKPKIRIARLDLNSFPNVVLPDQDNNVDTTEGDADDQDDENGEAIYLRSGRRSLNAILPNNVNTTEEVDNNDEEEATIVVRSRRRRSVAPRQRLEPVPNLANIVEEPDEESNDGEEMVLLVPRVVLERITVTPSRRSRYHIRFFVISNDAFAFQFVTFLALADNQAEPYPDLWPKMIKLCCQQLLFKILQDWHPLLEAPKRHRNLVSPSKTSLEDSED